MGRALWPIVHPNRRSLSIFDLIQDFQERLFQRSRPFYQLLPAVFFRVTPCAAVLVPRPAIKV
jgi:hypothetical protein